MTIAYIGLGSNLAQPVLQLRQACQALGQLQQSTLLATSPCYQSKALAVPGSNQPQPDFINAAVKLQTSLSAAELLAALHDIEAGQGRERIRHWGDRTLDLDLLLYGQLQHSSPELQLPHPRIYQRRFVLQPLFDLTPSLVIPGQGDVATLLKNCESAPIDRLQETLSRL